MLILGATPDAAKKDPTGSFTLSAPPYVEGSDIVFTIQSLTGVTRSCEVTLGVWCFLPDGSQIPWGNRNNPYIYEFNSFGTSYLGYPCP